MEEDQHADCNCIPQADKRQRKTTSVTHKSIVTARDDSAINLSLEANSGDKLPPARSRIPGRASDNRNSGTRVIDISRGSKRCSRGRDHAVAVPTSHGQRYNLRSRGNV